MSSRRPPVHSFSLSPPYSGRLQHLRSCRPSGICLIFFLLVVGSADAAKLSEYTAAEAKKHIGETAKVTGKVDCVDAHRRSHILTLGGCGPKMDFYVRVAYGAPGPALNVTELKGVVITVSGSEVDDLPFIEVTSTSQIVPHGKANPK